MASAAVIDLLSSDDDKVKSKSSVAKGKARLKSNTSNDYLSLRDDSDTSLHLDHEWGTKPAKRRRLSSSSPHVQDGVLSMLPSHAQIEQNSKPSASTIRGNLQSEDVWATIDDQDSIVFTSSAHHTNTVTGSVRNGRSMSRLQSDESDDSLPEDALSIGPCRSNIANLSGRTAALLASLDQPVQKPRPTGRRTHAREKSSKIDRPLSQASGNRIVLSQDKVISTLAGPSRPKKAKFTEEERQKRSQDKERAKEERARKRELSKAERANEKEEDKERKRASREENDKVKKNNAAVAEANKVKIDKKDSSLEMIVDLPASIEGSKIDIQTRELLKNLNVDTTLYQSSVPNVVKWRRKTKRRWDADAEQWEPLDRLMVDDEKHILCLMPAQQFASLAMAAEGDEDVETHVVMLESAHAGCIPIYLIEGLEGLLRKSKTAENRAYQAQVLAQDQTERQASQQPKRSQFNAVDENRIEDALLRLQVMHHCLVHHTTEEAKSAEWIVNFTQHVSTIPHKYCDLPMVTPD